MQLISNVWILRFEMTAPDVCHEVAGHYIFSRALRRKNWRMRAAPWKSGPSGPRKPFGIS